VLPFQHGPEIGGEDMPAGLGVFRGVEGAFAGGAFAPAGGVVEVEFGEEDAAFGDAVHAGFEGGEEFEVYFAEGERTDLHWRFIMTQVMGMRWVFWEREDGSQKKSFNTEDTEIGRRDPKDE